MYDVVINFAAGLGVIILALLGYGVVYCTFYPDNPSFVDVIRRISIAALIVICVYFLGMGVRYVF